MTSSSEQMDNQEFIRQLLSPERLEASDPFVILSFCPLNVHDTVADIGCGPGYFAIPLGKHVFDGKVYALDAQQEMLDAAKEALQKVNLTNVELVLTKDERLPLDDDSLDGALAAFVVHGAGAKGLLEETRRCLRNGGWLALLEWHKDKTVDGPPVRQRIEEARLRAMAEKAGFRYTARHNLNDSQYMLLMRK